MFCLFFQLDIKMHSSSCFLFIMCGDNLPKVLCFAIITLYRWGCIFSNAYNSHRYSADTQNHCLRSHLKNVLIG